MRLLWGRAALLGALVVLVGAAPAQAQLLEKLLKPSPPPRHHVNSEREYENPVLRGDYPDPSALRNSEGWWAVVTSGGWRPPFSIIQSPDLVNWQVAGRVLRRRPRWAKTDFWAPEVVSWGNRYRVYYAARNRRGRFCIGVASSSRVVGFFHDHGPVVCPRLGAIDPLAVRDEAGRPNLLWKEDGNNRGLPTPIVGAPLSADGLRLAGPRRELLRNDSPWEGGVVEAPTMTRHDGRFYLLYSARSCCTATCDYVTGAARSETLYGRWEKHPGPIFAGNSSFRCPGHGSVTDAPDGRQFLVYHAYDAHEPLLVGRQLLVDRLGWTPTGWPVLGDGRGPSRDAISPLHKAQRARRPAADDEFTGRWLAPAWQWPTDRPHLRLDRARGGRLLIGPARADGKLLPGVAGRQPAASNFAAEAVLGRRTRGARPGLAVYTARDRAVGIELRRSRVVVWRSQRRGERVLASARIRRRRPTMFRVQVVDGQWFTFRVAVPGGWRQVGPTGYRPPFWLYTPRVVLRVDGARRDRAAFERFRLVASR
jgi:xylan 1,4-beta-xylosidase